MKRFAIIGCGKIASLHAENILRVGKLVAVCDIDREAADALAKATGAAAFYSIDDLLKQMRDVEVVAVCSPHGYHAEHIIKSLQAGKHVLAEKPLCLTVAAAWQIIETQKFCRRRLFVVKSARYNPIIKRLKQALTGGELGRVYSFHLNCIWHRNDAYYTGWKGKRFPDGGSLYNQFSHYLDATLWLFGELAEAKGFVGNAAHTTAIEFEDEGVAALQMTSGAIGSLHWTVNAFKHNHEIGLTIVAEKGTVRIGGPYLNTVEYVHTEAALQLASLPAQPIRSHNEIYDHLIATLAGADTGLPDAFDGLRTVEAIEKIYKATS